MVASLFSDDSHFVTAGVPDAQSLAVTVKNRWAEKYDSVLTDELMALEYASRHLDPRGAWETLAEIVESSANTAARRQANHTTT